MREKVRSLSDKATCYYLFLQILNHSELSFGFEYSANIEYSSPFGFIFMYPT